MPDLCCLPKPFLSLQQIAFNPITAIKCVTKGVPDLRIFTIKLGEHAIN